LLDLKVSDLGATQFKNITDPVRVYGLEVGIPAGAKVAKPADPLHQGKPGLPKGRSASIRLVAGIVTVCIVIAAGI